MKKHTHELSVLVTGGAGYIGSHTCKVLKRNGFIPVVLDNLTRGHREFVKWGPLEEGDIRDEHFLSNVFKTYKPVAVMHFAGLAYVEESMRVPKDYEDVNVNGTRNLLSAMKKYECDSIVFSSSCAVYGEVKSNAIDELTPLLPINPYGATKKAAEMLLKEFSCQFDLRYVALRYFNAVGADPDGDVGEWHEPETHLLPLVIKAALSGKKFKVYGKDYKTKDGTCIRDLIHVVDLAEGHVLALNYLLNRNSSVCLNLGSGSGISILELIKEVERITKLKVNYEFSEKRDGDPSMLVAKALLAKNLLGWTPGFANEDKIFHAWNWYIKNLERFNDF